MQVIEFEAISQHHRIQVPEEIPDGVRLRVVLLWEHTVPSAHFKSLFASVTEGLTDEELKRPNDLLLNPFTESASL